MKKHYPVSVSYSLPGQPGVVRSPQLIMQQGTTPEICAKRALATYRRQLLKGKKNITFYIRVMPQDTSKF